MSTAASKFKSSGTPDMAAVCLALVAVLGLGVLVFVVVGQWDLATLYLTVAGCFLLGAYYFMYRGRRVSVTITADEVIISGRRTTKVIRRVDIKSIDLATGYRQLELTDGSYARLPLEGAALLNAAVVLGTTSRPHDEFEIRSE